MAMNTRYVGALVGEDASQHVPTSFLAHMLQSSAQKLARRRGTKATRPITALQRSLAHAVQALGVNEAAFVSSRNWPSQQVGYMSSHGE